MQSTATSLCNAMSSGKISKTGLIPNFVLSFLDFLSVESRTPLGTNHSSGSQSAYSSPGSIYFPAVLTLRSGSWQWRERTEWLLVASRFQGSILRFWAVILGCWGLGLFSWLFPVGCLSAPGPRMTDPLSFSFFFFCCWTGGGYALLFSICWGAASALCIFLLILSIGSRRSILLSSPS